MLIFEFLQYVGLFIYACLVCYQKKAGKRKKRRRNRNSDELIDEWDLRQVTVDSGNGAGGAGGPNDIGYSYTASRLHSNPTRPVTRLDAVDTNSGMNSADGRRTYANRYNFSRQPSHGPTSNGLSKIGTGYAAGKSPPARISPQNDCNLEGPLPAALLPAGMKNGSDLNILQRNHDEDDDEITSEPETTNLEKMRPMLDGNSPHQPMRIPVT